MPVPSLVDMQTLRPQEDRPFPTSEAERDAIRRQLDRMLADPLFKNSKRFPSLLRHVVERTLEGHSSELKERALGAEVFGREPHYDTNADPIVRATAGEIRKRIAQYYHEQEHQAEIRINLSPGSYVPEFEIPVVAQPVPARPEPVAMPIPVRKPAFYRYAAILVCIALALTAIAWYQPWHFQSALDQFWGPVLDSSNTVLVCIGQRSFLASAQEPRRAINPDVPSLASTQGDATPITMSKLYYMGSQNVAFHDAQTLGRLTGLLQTRGRQYHILGESSTSFADLRDSPVILVGAFNNDWTIRLMGPMRYSFERNGAIMWIRDRQNPTDKRRAVNYDTPYLSLNQDYALISRVLDPSTERMVVVAAGLTGYGTMAAGEFLTNPSYLEAAAKQAPKDWGRKNMQLVIATEVINGNSGPPHVVDRYYW